MASLKDLKAASAREDEGAVVVIYQKGSNEPYLAADGSEATATIVGTESSTYRARRRAFLRRQSKRAPGPVGPEEAERYVLEELACAVIAWHGWEDGDEPLDCTTENVIEWLAWDHIYNQVHAAAHKPSGFFGGVSRGSSLGSVTGHV